MNFLLPESLSFDRPQVLLVWVSLESYDSMLASLGKLLLFFRSTQALLMSKLVAGLSDYLYTDTGLSMHN